jgi:RNA polymerase sigma factor (sigma-70 family)
MRSGPTFSRSHAIPAGERDFSRDPQSIRPSWIWRGAFRAMVPDSPEIAKREGIRGQETEPEYFAPKFLMIQHSSDQEHVLPRIASGESRAMNECITRHGGLVWGIVRRAVKDSAAAEDLVQEVFTEIWKKAGSFNPAVASEATFIALVARRRTIDFLRRQGRQPGFEPLEAAESIPATAPSESSLDCDPEAVRTSVASLPDDTRQLFHLFFEHGYTHPEIAEKTGLPIGTIKTRLRRGLITLREQLSRVKHPNSQPAS